MNHYVAILDTKHGDFPFKFRSEKSPLQIRQMGQLELARQLGVDFDPDNGEYLDVHLVDEGEAVVE